jgi:predicted GNAT family acetyltransferase
VQKAGLEDCRELAELIYSVPEFARFYYSCMEIERGIRRRMELGICRYFILKKDGVIASQAYTTIESSKYATIGGVVTREGHRNQGLASLIVSCISQDILKDNKIQSRCVRS